MFVKYDFYVVYLLFDKLNFCTSSEAGSLFVGNLFSINNTKEIKPAIVITCYGIRTFGEMGRRLHIPLSLNDFVWI